MPYLNDPREHSIDPMHGFQWEGDNRVEERWKWGASILDLCGMSPEDYQTTIFHTDCSCRCTSGESTTKTTNPITVSIEREEDTGDVIMYAVASKRVYATLSVVADWTILFDDGSDAVDVRGVVEIPEGETEGSAIILIGKNGGIEKSEATVNVGATEDSADKKTYEDDVFKYTVSDITADISIYYGTFPYTGDVSTLTLDMLSAVTQASYDKYPITFVIPAGNGYLATSQEELDAETLNCVLVIPEKYRGNVSITGLAGEVLQDPVNQLFFISEEVSIAGMDVYIRNGHNEVYTGEIEDTTQEAYNLTIKQ